MSVALRRQSDPSQAETPGTAPRGPEPQGETAFARSGTLPAAERARSDRRGPLRPSNLSSSRTRMAGWTLAMIFRLADAAVLAGVALGSAAAAAWLTGADFGLTLVAPFALGALMLAWGLSMVRAYGFGQAEGLARHLVRVAAGFGVAALMLGAVLAGFRPMGISVEALGLWFCGSFAGLDALHVIWWLRVRAWRRQGRLTPNIVVVGATANAERLIAAALKSRDVAVLGVFDDRAARIPPDIAGVPVLGDTSALIGHRIMPYVDRVVITVSSLAQSRVRQIVEKLNVLPNEVMLFVDQGVAGRAAALSRITDAPLAPVSGLAANERRALVKRIEDLVIGALALVLGAPLMLLVALAIRLDSPGPIFFRQRRHGFNNEEIVVWKFRSMRQETTDHTAARQVKVGDERVTRVGRFIRRTSLDELPQIFNVLAGTMSLVGPRPHAVGMKTGSTESARLVAHYAHRHRQKPGMTGWAAIQGSRGPVDTPDLVRRRVALDIEYIERQSLWLDLYIMAMTIPCLLGDRAAVR